LAGVLAVSLWACGGSSWLHVRHVPEDGYAETLNYQFRATVHADTLGNCRTMSVEVKPINKVYSGGEPPSRLQLFDDDCRSPVRFERAQFISNESGAPVRLSGSEVNRFLRNFVRLEDELIGWLWREGVI
jgi:hypothetical protein